MQVIWVVLFLAMAGVLLTSIGGVMCNKSDSCKKTLGVPEMLITLACVAVVCFALVETRIGKRPGYPQ